MLIKKKRKGRADGRRKKGSSDPLASFVTKRIDDFLSPLKRTKKRKSRFSTPYRRIHIAKAMEHFSIAKYIRGVSRGDWTDAPLEHWHFKKALSSQTIAAGGALVPMEYSKDFIDLLRAKAVVRNMGVSTYNLRGDTLMVAGQSAGVSVSWIAEGANKETYKDEPTFMQKQMVLKEVIGLVQIQNNLLADSSPAADDIVKRDLVSALRNAEDLAFIQGLGGNQPMGIANDPLVTTTTLGGGNGAIPTYDDLMDAMYTIEAANGTYTGWVAHPRTKNTLRQLKDGSGRYLLELGNVAKGLNDQLLGMPVGWSTQVPVNLTAGTGTALSYLILANWPEFLIGQKEGIELVATDVGGTSFQYDQTWVRAVLRVDCMVRQPNEFIVIAGIKA